MPEDSEEPLKTSHEPEDMQSARGVGLCVTCPLVGAYVPVIGTCVEAHVVEGRRENVSVKLHGIPHDPWHEFKKLCQYAELTTSKVISGDLTGIKCDPTK